MPQTDLLSCISLKERVQHESILIKHLTKEIKKTIIGQTYMIERLLIAVLGGGHILLEGVPGLAKTLAAKTMATAIDATFSRIQFTPDLLPSDITGTTIFSMETNNFIPKKGPIFANFVLADEINRAPEKVQSALLEAMQENQVTIGEYTYKLESPFTVLATQNPVEQHGTYTLPEAQLDRFMLKILIDYPQIDEERLIMRNNLSTRPHNNNAVLTKDKIVDLCKLVKEIYLDEKIESYILNIVFSTRYPDKFGFPQLQNFIKTGVSPRGSINLATAAKACAFLNERDYVIPEDVKEVVADVLRHRISLTYAAEAENLTQDDMLHEIINQIPIP
ncbi:ATPase AAA [Adhaeribacter aerolatus]|uniref:ATPase AAA n=1 Tax=Adhaeribacter aerolatus TaxID=670289 RepID=A0A512AWR2_9BACT|nr:MoxR family ATPase [Adhaeribacter aerolatus]GEO04152.1 ATPase AAA [Adhaeribacter aerolatus]